MTGQTKKEPEWVEVDVRGVHTERPRRFGDVWLAVELLKRLGLDEFFREALGRRWMKNSWAEVVSILVAARFCELRSELHVAEHFCSQSALADLSAVPDSAIYSNRLFRVLD